MKTTTRNLAIIFFLFLFSNPIFACEQLVRKECLTRLGAGTLESDEKCGVELQSYISCLKDRVEAPGTEIQKPGPIEIGTLLIVIADLFHSNERISTADLVETFGESVKWNSESAKNLYINKGPLIGTLDIKILDNKYNSPSGVGDNVWTIKVLTGECTACSYDVFSITFKYQNEWGYMGGANTKKSIKLKNRDVSIKECEYENVYTRQNIWKISGAERAFISEDINQSIGNKSSIFSIRRDESESLGCGSSAWYVHKPGDADE